MARTYHVTKKKSVILVRKKNGFIKKKNYVRRQDKKNKVGRTDHVILSHPRHSKSNLTVNNTPLSFLRRLF